MTIGSSVVAEVLFDFGVTFASIVARPSSHKAGAAASFFGEICQEAFDNESFEYWHR
jgi:hypothetical protein